MIRGLLLSALLISTSFAVAAPVCSFKNVSNKGNSCSDFAFTTALQKGDLETVQAMLKANPALVNACNSTVTDFDQFSSLTFAICRAGDKETLPAIVSLLLQEGADITCKSKNLGVTAHQCAHNIADLTIREQVLELLNLVD